MTATWLKLLHIAALAVWSAGLIFLPGLIRRQSHAEQAGERGVHLRAFVRASYLLVVSPAAVIAIGSGMALLFVREAFAGWMFVKLAAVGGMVLLHVHHSRSVRSTGKREAPLPALEAVVVKIVTVGLVVAVLWLALGKPDLDDSLFPDWARRPLPAAG